MDESKIIEAFDEAKQEVWTDDDQYTVGYNNGLEAGKNIAIDLLKEQEEYVPLEPVVMYLSHYASPPEMYPGIHTPEEERELWRKTLKSIK